MTQDEYIHERFYLEKVEGSDEMIIRRRPALPKARPGTLTGTEPRDESYCRIWNRRAHAPLNGRPMGARVDGVRTGDIWVKLGKGRGEVKRDKVIAALLSDDNWRDCFSPDPFEAEAPEGMFRRKPKRSWNEEQKLRAEIRRALYVDQYGAILRREIDLGAAAQVHPALVGLAEGWNKRFADQPACPRAPHASSDQYIRIGSKNVRVDDVHAALGITEGADT